MGNPHGFMKTKRKLPPKRSASDRTNDFDEFILPWSEEAAREQGERCMGCSVPFCHKGCPLGNRIPDWNDLVYRGQWHSALNSLHATNNFPEFTGRVCPAPCESSCVLAINQDPVTIEYIEKAIADRGWSEGWITPQPPSIQTGKKVAVVGSGPAGLATAQQVRRCGHEVIVFERNEMIGGLLRFGIPDFKLDKKIVQRRVDQMIAEGIVFKTSVHVGENYPSDRLVKEFDAICLTGGSTQARDLPVPGRELGGIHLAMEYLTQQNRINAGSKVDPIDRISAEGKRVVILGGGDTGSDCLGTSHRQGAETVYQFELLSEPPLERSTNNPWPEWPLILRSSASHDEGGVRDYDILTKRFSGSNGRVKKLHAVRIEWVSEDSKERPSMHEIPESAFEIETDLVLLALGFVHPERDGMISELGVEVNARGNIKVDENKMSSIAGIFAAGDMVRGQSLVVWALAEGREAARGIDEYLTGKSTFP
ncbi:MAG: glutamate synthase subunit beta [SAR202 cluster bacterium]|jgi:glutamate synthase (NADPH/NADH) small chain|nr:glutamate synthase subunit beta [SAR202 cluster bacterium]